MRLARKQTRSEVDSRFLIDPFEPAYLALHGSGQIGARIAAGLRELEDCCACPRNCHINRMAGETNICHTGRFARVASAFAHFGEEDCLRGWNGSGTIFFSLCNLRCVFCQNWNISQKSVGREYPPERIAELMLRLQEQGCHNINFVTPEHVAPQTIEAIAAAIPRGLRVRHLVMPGQLEEAAAIFRWLAEEISPDTYVNIMGQYHPEYEVGQIARNGQTRYDDINRRPQDDEVCQAIQAGLRAGLWRFDERWR